VSLNDASINHDDFNADVRLETGDGIDQGHVDASGSISATARRD
jgi:hypothetical protein